MVAQAFVETVLTSIGVSAFAMSVNMSIQKKPVHMAAHMSVHMPTHTWSWRSVRIRAGDIFVHCSSSVSSTVMNCASVTVAIPWDARMRLAKFVEPCVPACVRSSVQGPVSFCGCVRPVRPPKKTMPSRPRHEQKQNALGRLAASQRCHSWPPVVLCFQGRADGPEA